jgi:hypothetical protein
MNKTLKDMLCGAAFVTLLALWAWAFAYALHSPPMDCRPVDYVHGAWLNPAGQVVAVAPTEDSVMHYVGKCS